MKKPKNKHARQGHRERPPRRSVGVWKRFDKEWCIKIPDAEPGQVVLVQQKNGVLTRELLGERVWLDMYRKVAAENASPSETVRVLDAPATE